MNTLSGPSLGLLVEVAADTFTQDNLATLLLRADLEHDEYLHPHGVFIALENLGYAALAAAFVGGVQ